MPIPGRIAVLLLLATAPVGEAPPARHSELIAGALIRAGSDVDARDRELGTALDVAEKEGRQEIAALLRSRGARGSGKSVGDVVCVTPWAGDGFCGRVQSRSGNRLRLGLLWLEGCALGCAPEAECSGGRPVGGATAQALHAGNEVVVPSWCLTRTAVPPRP